MGIDFYYYYVIVFSKSTLLSYISQKQVEGDQKPSA